MEHERTSKFFIRTNGEDIWDQGSFIGQGMVPFTMTYRSTIFNWDTKKPSDNSQAREKDHAIFIEWEVPSQKCVRSPNPI